MDDPAGADGLVLQRLPLDRAVALRGLYVREPQPGLFPLRCRAERGELTLAAGAVLSFDTYFGAFFERAWRGPTTLRSLACDLDIRGGFALRLVRRSAAGEQTTLHEAQHRRFAGRLSVPVPTPPLLAAGGRVFVEVTAGRAGCTIAGLQWRAPDTPTAGVGLVPVFCTFGREMQLGAVLATLAAEPSCWQDLPRIVVVNQGTPGFAAHPVLHALPAGFRARLTIVEQGNFGGAGGFTRGLLEALDIPGATHAVLMDDDVAAEPEALRRTAAFFAIARPRVALGGHMLDMLQPTRLYEAGARVDPATWYLKPIKPGLPLAEAGSLDTLMRPAPMHYNGWWYCALPLAVVREAALPMPCFIRGDDVEYGIRLARLGIPTVGLPGVAIWHEPFYAKLNGWQGYYELRNMLVAASVHMPRPARGLATLLLKRLLGHLLSFRYHEAALLLLAFEHWLRGPAIFDAPPAQAHASVQALRRSHPATTFPGDRVAEPLAVPPDPRGRVRFLARLARTLLRQALAPTRPDALPQQVPGADFVWFRVGHAEHLAVDTEVDADLPTFHRSRETFRAQLGQGLRLAARLLREGDATTAAWARAFPGFTSDGHWRRYLGMQSGVSA